MLRFLALFLGLLAAPAFAAGPTVEVNMAQTEPSVPQAMLRPGALIGPRWALVEIAGEPAPSDTKAHMLFDGARLAGDGGCNRMGAGYVARPDGAFLAGLAMSTMMMCPEPAMRTERAVFAALDAARGWSMAGDRLTLRDADGASLAVFAARPPE